MEPGTGHSCSSKRLRKALFTVSYCLFRTSLPWSHRLPTKAACRTGHRQQPPCRRNIRCGCWAGQYSPTNSAVAVICRQWICRSPGRPLCPYQCRNAVLTCPYLLSKVDLTGHQTMNAITNRNGTPCSRMSKFLSSLIETIYQL